MPTVTFNKKEFLCLVGKKLSDVELRDRIPMLGTELEALDATTLTVEVFPNRPDLLSEQGFARAFSSFLGIKPGLKNHVVRKSKVRVIVNKNVTMRPYTACAIVKNLKFTDESLRQLMQIQEKLAVTHGRNRKKSAYGVYPLKDIQFPIHYTAKDPSTVRFTPLGFDHEILASDIEKLHPKGKEYSSLAQGWQKYPFFIDNAGKIMSMLPYTNSQDLGKVDVHTKEIFVECSGTDFYNVTSALNILATMFEDMGGDLYSLDVVYADKTVTTPNLTPSNMKLDLQYLNNLLGVTLKENDVVRLLGKMGYDYQKGQVLVPAYRVDVLHPMDLVEDIAIAYGYEHFIPEIPRVATIAEEYPFAQFKRLTATVLVGYGLFETNTHHLSNVDDQSTNMQQKITPLALTNALNADFNVLRAGMLPSLLRVLQCNKHYDYPQRFFEIGTVFTDGQESDHLCCVLSGEVTYTNARQLLDGLFRSFGLLKVSYLETEHASFIPGRVADVVVLGKKVAVVGEVHPAVLTNFSLEMPTGCFELDLTLLHSLLKP